MTTNPNNPTSANGLQSKSEQTRAAIILAAARHFRYEGYTATTMRKIAELAEMEAGSIYYHFSSKEEILDEVLDLGLRRLFDEARHVLVEAAKQNLTFQQTFAAMVDTHLVFLLEESDFTSANIRNFPTLPKELRRSHRPLRQAYSDLWNEFMTQAQDAGIIRGDMEIAPLRQFVLGALNWTVEWYDAKRYPVSQLSGRLSKLLLEGMAVKNSAVLDYLPTAQPDQAPVKPGAGKKANRTRLKILSAAARIIRDRGYKAATMRTIALEAGIEAGSVYYHFGSKEEILDKVLDLGLRDLLEGMVETVSDENTFPNDLSRVAAAIETHLKYLFRSSEFTSANIRIYGQLPKDVRARHWPVRHEYAKVWDNILEEAQHSNSIRSDIKIVPLRQVMLGALNWTVEWFDPDRSDQDGYYSLPELTNMLQKLLLGGLLDKG
ncbi:MAG: TetR family transcriptional regulator [Rhodobacteraceae bacterium]|nr:TetR family transcriptional regulator [Paracoccaceae bacterium]